MLDIFLIDRNFQAYKVILLVKNGIEETVFRKGAREKIRAPFTIYTYALLTLYMQPWTNSWSILNKIKYAAFSL